ncbi:MAG: VOC family protein [Patulibacter minatonensis]
MFKDAKAFGGFSVDDVLAAKAFYGDVLGIDVDGPQSPEMPIIMLELAGGDRPTVVYGKPDHEPATFTVLNFPAKDVPGTVGALIERGVVFERYEGTPMQTDDDFVFRGGGPLIAWFKDPAGNVLSVVEDAGDDAD